LFDSLTDGGVGKGGEAADPAEFIRAQRQERHHARREAGRPRNTISAVRNLRTETETETNLKGANGMATKLTPLHDRILVKRIEEGETVRGGIIIPDTAKEKPQEGEVIAVGKGKISEEGKVRPLDVKEGDRILFGKYAGTEIKIDNNEFLIMREEEVLGILQGAHKPAHAGSRR
jgi:chaperonin GroES